MKAYSTYTKPRRKQSRNRGVNLQDSKRVSSVKKRSRIKWDEIAQKRNIQEPVRNEDRRVPATDEDLVLPGSTDSEEVRTRRPSRRRKAKRRQKSMLKQHYSGVSMSNVYTNREGNRRRPKRSHNEESLRSGVARRLDQVRWNSGLAVSLGQARRRITQGHVRVSIQGTEMEKRTRPSMKRTPGTRVSMTSSMWKKQRPQRKQWWGAEWNMNKRVPSYREVDRVYGALYVVGVPLDGEVTWPLDMKRSRRARTKK